MQKMNYVFEVKAKGYNNGGKAKFWNNQRCNLEVMSFDSKKDLMDFCRKNNALIYCTVEEYCSLFNLELDEFNKNEDRGVIKMRCPECGCSKFEIVRAEIMVGEVDEGGDFINISDRYLDNEYRFDCIECEFATTVYTDYENLGY